METFKRTPLQLFNLPQHFLVPLFQRPYVWREDEQWIPLWNDIRRVTELRINDPRSNATHFMGAVVLQAHDAKSKRMTTWNVIDGQQRLTTLQILADAACALLAVSGQARLSGQLERLTHNDDIYVEERDSRLKVRHHNKDRAAFDEVMTADPPVDHAYLTHADSQIVRAHEYFSTAVQQWLGAPDSAEYPIKAKELTTVLLDGLQLVSIELEASENSQEIFETLNARGTPLTAADLVRNFVFQKLEADGVDTRRAYREDWPFETKFWMEEVSVGRNLVSRSSLFLNQWLVARTGEEVSPQSTFTRFKSYVEHESGHAMSELLPIIKMQAHQYESWTEAARRPGGSLTATELAVYRMQAAGVEVLKPLLIWLHEPGRGPSEDSAGRIINAAESWVFRRQLLRLSGSDLGRIIADVIAANANVPASDLAERVSAHLARLNVTSTYWPGDEEVRRALTTEAAYTRFPRGRLRMMLEAVEDHYRDVTGQPQIERKGYPIEHLLPRSWRDTWPVNAPDEAEGRQARVHRLGNLTLLTKSLNSKVSNGAWPVKRAALQDHNTIILTGRVIKRTEIDAWNEELIDERTAELIDTLLRVWPVPEGHHGKVADPQTKAGDWVELRHLIAGGFLAPGDRLFATHRDHKGRQAIVTADGAIDIDGKRYSSPSAAGSALQRGATNGWYFWAVADGRRLRDVRTDFQNSSDVDERVVMSEP
ncbi:GmrSD restriction endonuclease domain-containing protein [Microbacterium arborescens]|uniref:GmrSD restriction endonuclease domain-containing protein n=1 Tax=Microbacterium arborescens TaxID=33883 RepID=UPI003C758EF1